MNISRNSLLIRTLKEIDGFIYDFYLKFLKLIGFMEISIPPKSLLRKTSSSTAKHFIQSGIKSSLPIEIEIKRRYARNKKIELLDFGCGCGRQLIHLEKNMKNIKFSACDIDSSSIQYMKKNFKKVNFNISNDSPPLIYKRDQFDVIYSISTFSHIPMEFQNPWLLEFDRILKPGGLLMLSTMGIASTYEKKVNNIFNISQYNLEKKLIEDGYIFKSANLEKDRNVKIFKRAKNNLGFKRDYGDILMSKEFIMENWEVGNLKVIDIIEDIIDNLQDLVILKKEY